MSLEERISKIEHEITLLNNKFNQVEISNNNLTIFLTENYLDKAICAFMMAVAGKSLGMNVKIFFSLWGISLLRQNNISNTKISKTIPEWIFSKILPVGPNSLKTSRLNFFGLGSWMLNYLIRTKNQRTFPEYIELAKQLEIEFCVCTMSMEIIGLKMEDLINYPHLTYNGMYNFLDSSKTGPTYFI